MVQRGCSYGLKQQASPLSTFAVSFSVVYALTGSFAIGGLIALIEPACNTVAYAIHEKVWERIGVMKAAPIPIPVYATYVTHPARARGRRA